MLVGISLTRGANPVVGGALSGHVVDVPIVGLEGVQGWASLAGAPDKARV